MRDRKESSHHPQMRRKILRETQEKGEGGFYSEGSLGPLQLQKDVGFHV